MFVTAVAWVAFVFGSLSILWAVLDTIFQISISKRLKALGYRQHYATGTTAFILTAWFLAGWHLFG